MKLNDYETARKLLVLAEAFEALAEDSHEYKSDFVWFTPGKETNGAREES